MIIKNSAVSPFKFNKKEDRRTNYETFYNQEMNHLPNYYY